MRFLFISALAESHALALRLLDEGHDVRFYIHSRTESDVGDGMVPKVKSWQPHVGWADIVIIDDVAQKTDAGQFLGGELAERLRKANRRVVGGTRWGDKLENDRLFAQAVFQQLGLDVVETAHFTSFEAARRFVKRRGGGWAVKHNEQVPRELNAVFWEPEEVIGFLEWLDEVYSDYAKGKPVNFILQQAVKGIEVAVTAFFNGREFVPNTAYINREVKKMMNEDEGPSCYSEDTEVLTKRGWVKFCNLTYQDEILTKEPTTDEMFYEKPSAIIWRWYEGPMYWFQGRNYDLLVTPTHNMWVCPKDRWKNGNKPWNGQRDFRFVPAEGSYSEFIMERGGKWKGEKATDIFVIPGREDRRKHRWPDTIVSMDTWLAFLGLFASEGYVYSKGRTHRVYICQDQENPYFDKIRAVLNSLPWNYRLEMRLRTETKIGGRVYKYDKPHTAIKFRISNHSLAKWLLENVGRGAKNKRVPEFIKVLPPEKIQIFLDYFLYGDGYLHKRRGLRRFVTASKQLADDIQELLLKTGRAGGITQDKRTGVYTVYEYTKNHMMVQKHNQNVVWYKGYIGCVTVPTTHLIYVRRNNKALWCGNTGQVGEIGRFISDCRLYRETLPKFAPLLERGGYCTWFDLNCIVTRDRIVPLEVTARPGYPSVFAFTHGLQMPLGEFFKSVASGEASPIPVSRDWIATVVVAGGTFPHEDPEANKHLLIDGLDTEGWYVHPNEVRRVGKQYRGAGSMGYAAVVTAKGKTIESAAENAYAIAKRVKVVPYRKIRTDVHVKAAQDYPKLFEWGWLN